jgi:hypothetical protein
MALLLRHDDFLLSRPPRLSLFLRLFVWNFQLVVGFRFQVLVGLARLRFQLGETTLEVLHLIVER